MREQALWPHMLSDFDESRNSQVIFMRNVLDELNDIFDDSLINFLSRPLLLADLLMELMLQLFGSHGNRYEIHYSKWGLHLVILF